MIKPLYLLDGYSVIYRSYFAFIRNPIINSKRENVSAIFGFYNILFSFMRKFNPERLIVTMDSLAPTFRHEMYDQYKANREKTPKDLHDQVQPIIDLLDAMGIPVVRYDRYEADDLMGALAKDQERKGGEAYIISGDKDLLQLVSESIFVLKPEKSQFIKMGPKEVFEDRGVRPDQMIDYLALMGDTADNIPGVAGIGPKTAAKLLDEFHTLDGIYENIDQIKAKSQKNKLIDNKENAFFSKTLVTIETDIDLVQFSIDKKLTRDDNRVISLFKEWEINNLLKDYSALFPRDEMNSEQINYDLKENLNWQSSKASYITIQDKEKLDDVLSLAGKSLVLSFDCETNSLDEMHAEPVGFSFSWEPGKGYYLPIKHITDEVLDENYVREKLQKFFDMGSFKLVGQNFKYDYKVLSRWGLKLPELYFDTMIAAWMLESDERSNMDALALKYLNYDTIHFKDIVPKGETFDMVPLDMATPYAAEDSDITLQLFSILRKNLQLRKLDKLFFELEMPLVYLLAKMELTGISLNVKELKEYGILLGEELVILEKNIFEMCGEEFNIRSTKELQRILFEVRSLPTGKKTKTGYSTDISILENLAKQDPVPELILKHRGLSKLKSTYIDSLIALVDSQGKIHTHFVQTGTATGRIASKDPNLQNIPVRDDKGRMIRMAFMADENKVFLSADYSQIELVVLAHLSEDKALCNAFLSGRDVHKQTASLIFNKEEEEISSDERRIAKTINFGVMYGMSPFRLSNELNISRNEAALFIEKYFEKYSRVKEFIDETIIETELEGGVKTLMERFRTIGGINSRNKTEKQGAQRAAINSKIQGSAADIVKKAMLQLNKILVERFPQVDILLQVHDECIFHVPTELTNEVSLLVKDIMENIITLRVPLMVNVEVGKRWGEIH